MSSNFLRKAVLIAAVVAMPSLANAGQPFDAKAFQASQAAGESILVDVTAPWCPTCKEQKPIVQALLKDAKRKSLTVFVADFDKEEALKKQLKVTMQSTLVAFKGGKEVARSTGQTDKAELGALLDKAL